MTDRAGAPIGPVPLCGFSHGASGIAYALLRLFQRSGRVEFLYGARTAFAYEDEMFDSRLDTWPDLRADGSGAFDAWCHGAGGVALARLYAMRCDTQFSDRHRAVASAALERTRIALRAVRVDGEFGLCHGVAGLAEICRAGGEAMSIPSLVSEANNAAALLADRFNALGKINDWPAELTTSPGLMLGVSGAGYSLLNFGGARLTSGADRLPGVLTVFGS